MAEDKKVTRVSVAEITYEPDTSIVIIDYFDNKAISKEDAEEVISTSMQLVGDNPFGVISIFKDNLIKADAQEVLRQESPNLVAVASIVKSEILKSIFNTFVSFKKLGYKFRMFTDLEEAKQWVASEIEAFKKNS